MLTRFIQRSQRVLTRHNVQALCRFSESPWSVDRTYLASSWRSDAEKRIAEVPVIEVANHVAVCEGGSGALGHPIQYIQLDRVNPAPAVCKYCGLRFKMAKRYNRFGKEKKFNAH